MTKDPVAAWSDLRVAIFADGADLDSIRKLSDDPAIKGFTTNPTLMRNAGVTDYLDFAQEVLAIVSDRPISFEVFADEEAEMERQARILSSLGPNVFVKIPITTTDGTSTRSLAHRLTEAEIQLNVTAIFTLGQLTAMLPALSGKTRAYVSVFAGRIADAGIDPVPIMQAALSLLEDHPNIELIWASPREVRNVVQAHEIGCHVITVTSDLLAKLPKLGTDLEDFSLQTVRMFEEDARASGFRL